MRNWTARTSLETIQICQLESDSVLVKNANSRIQMAPEVLCGLSNQEQSPPANTIFRTHGHKTGSQRLQHHIPTEFYTSLHLLRTSCFMGRIIAMVWLRQGSFFVILSSRRPSALASCVVQPYSLLVFLHKLRYIYKHSS